MSTWYITPAVVNNDASAAFVNHPAPAVAARPALPPNPALTDPSAVSIDANLCLDTSKANLRRQRTAKSARFAERKKANLTRGESGLIPLGDVAEAGDESPRGDGTTTLFADANQIIQQPLARLTSANLGQAAAENVLRGAFNSNISTSTTDQTLLLYALQQQQLQQQQQQQSIQQPVYPTSFPSSAAQDDVGVPRHSSNSATSGSPQRLAAAFNSTDPQQFASLNSARPLYTQSAVGAAQRIANIPADEQPPLSRTSTVYAQQAVAAAQNAQLARSGSLDPSMYHLTRNSSVLSGDQLSAAFNSSSTNSNFPLYSDSAPPLPFPTGTGFSNDDYPSASSLLADPYSNDSLFNAQQDVLSSQPLLVADQSALPLPGGYQTSVSASAPVAVSQMAALQSVQSLQQGPVMSAAQDVPVAFYAATQPLPPQSHIVQHSQVLAPQQQHMIPQTHLMQAAVQSHPQPPLPSQPQQIQQHHQQQSLPPQQPALKQSNSLPYPATHYQAPIAPAHSSVMSTAPQPPLPSSAPTAVRSRSHSQSASPPQAQQAHLQTVQHHPVAQQVVNNNAYLSSSSAVPAHSHQQQAPPSAGSTYQSVSSNNSLAAPSATSGNIRSSSVGHGPHSVTSADGKDPSRPSRGEGRSGASQNSELKGRYHICEYLGHGSYGHVYSALHVQTNEKVAIKRIVDVFEDITHTKRLLRELRILRMLEHENIIEFREILAPQDINNFRDLFIVFEFVDTDLQKLINSNQHFTNLHIQFFLYQLLCGLSYMHSANIIHRDLKPANLLVNADCSLKICDFGLARGVHLTNAERSHGLHDLPFLPTRQGKSPGGSANSPDGPVVAPQPGDRRGREEWNGQSEQDGQKRRRTDAAGSSVPATGASSEPLPNGLTTSTEIPSARNPPLTRQLTKHVVTRWYRAPELILLLNDYTAAIDMWSVGCILAELLSMQKESVSSPKDRQALFPGKSCYPLSAESPLAFTEQADQLNVIFDIIGTPTEAEIDKTTPKAQRYLRALPPKPKVDFRKMYRGADPRAVDLLNRLLQFNPENRITAAEALRHPYLNEVRDPEIERTSVADPIDFEFEDMNLTPAALRRLIVDEILYYNPHLANQVNWELIEKGAPGHSNTNSNNNNNGHDQGGGGSAAGGRGARSGTNGGSGGAGGNSQQSHATHPSSTTSSNGSHTHTSTNSHAAHHQQLASSASAVQYHQAAPPQQQLMGQHPQQQYQRAPAHHQRMSSQSQVQSQQMSYHRSSSLPVSAAAPSTYSVNNFTPSSSAAAYASHKASGTQPLATASRSHSRAALPQPAPQTFAYPSPTDSFSSHAPMPYPPTAGYSSTGFHVRPQAAVASGGGYVVDLTTP